MQGLGKRASHIIVEKACVLVDGRAAGIGEGIDLNLCQDDLRHLSRRPHLIRTSPMDTL